MPSNAGTKRRALEVLERLQAERMPAPVRMLLIPARAALEAATDEQIHYAAGIASWLAWHAGRYVLEGNEESRQQLLGAKQEEKTSDQ